ncbi:protein TASOR 2 isoform X4 [Apodemus sylvaticus]|uniref:protein TASOR 2 isoform X3 n=1 Tax=Apodemus sylvaticus TaxID=10129 RepID=UPI002243CD46|nr:protein TASOR 2 isoform X3 [Apodemus sylvaticus]XP_052013336.1 protein TASOR 2 isoform X4 [Apodemus sylvaticus]
MAAPTYKSILELNKNALISPWKGQLVIQGCLLCDITLWTACGTVVPIQLPRELDFKYVMKVSSLKESLPEAAFRRRNYLDQKVCCQDLCFDLYEVELTNKQGENIDKLLEYIKYKELALIKCLEDRSFFILLTSSDLTPEPDFGDEQMGLHGLHLFHAPQPAGAKDLKVEDGLSLKVVPILPALSYALLEAKKSLSEEGIPPNILVKHSFQELYKADRSLSLMAPPSDGVRDAASTGSLPHAFDLPAPLETCPSESLTQLKCYFSDPTGYTLDLSAALDLLAEHPQVPCISDGICDAGFSLVMTPDPEFLDSEMEMRKETETAEKSGRTLKVKKKAMTPSSNQRVQPKRKATTAAVTRPSKRVSLGRATSKRTAPKTDNRSCNPTLKLVKGQFPQKRKRGAEVLTAQIVQKTRLERKKQEASVSKDAPVPTNAKRAKKQEKSPGRTASRPKPPVRKSPQKRKVNVARGRRNTRVRKQLKPAEKEIALHLQPEILSDGQKDGLNLSTSQQESIGMIPKGPPENSVITCDSQALNMLADLALSSAAASIPSCFSELPQNNVLLTKENSLHGASDHEYHKGVKSQKAALLPKPYSDEKISSESDLTHSQEENLAPPSAQPLAVAQPAPQEAREFSDASQNSVVVEHSYALLLAEQSKKHLHQRKLPSPAFVKNGTKGPEAGTPVGKVMPFRHLQHTSPLQKHSEYSLTKRKSLFVSSSLKEFFCSHTVLSCDGSFKITFKCEGEYVFSLDSKYTSNPLEKTVVRALHGPWNTDWPENMEDVKLLLHIWVALFYSKKNKAIGSPRKVTGGKAKQELPEKLETSNIVLSGVVSAQSNGTYIPSEDKTCQNTKMVSYNESVTQATLTTAHDETSSESMCQKTVFDNLENKVDTFHPSLLIKTGAVQDVIQHRSHIKNECPPSVERREDNVECMVNLEPVTLAFEKNANVPIHTEVNTTDKPAGFNTELVKQVSPALGIQCPVSALEKVQTQSARDVPSLAMSKYKGSKCLSADSIKKETPPESLCLLQKEISPLTSSADGLIMEAFSLVKSSSYSLASNKTMCPQDTSLQTQNGLSMSSDEVLEPSQVVSSTSVPLREQQFPNCILAMSDVAGGSSEIVNSDNSSLNQDKSLQTFNLAVFPKRTDSSMNKEEVSMELPGDDADINLTLTISPPTSPSEEIAAGEIEQMQGVPVSNVGQQSRSEEIVEPERQERLIKNRETNSASCMSVYPVESKESLKNCTPEVTEKVNVTSDFPFGPLIEVSPASSPDPILQSGDRQSSPCCLKLHGSQSEKTNKLSHIKSGDVTMPEKESLLVGPKGQDKLAQQMQLSAEMPQIPTNTVEVEGRVAVPGQVTEVSIPSEHVPFSEKVQCYDTELNKPTSPARYGGNFKPLEKPVKAGNSLEADCMENRDMDIKHLALESSVPLPSPRKVVENKSFSDTLVSVTTSGIVNMSLKQTNSENMKKSVCDSDVKTEADRNVQVGTENSASIDKTEVQACFHPEASKFVSSSDSAQCTYSTNPVNVEPGFQTQEIPVVRMASLLKNIGTELHEERMDLSATGLRSNSMSTKDEQKTIHVLQDTICEVKEFLNGDVFSQDAHSCQNTVDFSKSISEDPSASFVPELVDSVCGVYKDHTFSESPSMGHETKADAETLSRDTEISVNVPMCCGPRSGDCVQDSLDCTNCKFDVENLRGNPPNQKEAIKGNCESFTSLNNSDDTWACSSKISELETHIPPRNQETEPCPISPNKCMPCYIQIPDSHGIPKTYANFTVTKEFKDTTRRMHSLKRRRNVSANCNLLSSWTSTWHVTDDITQSTLDLEYLRFDHKLKQVIKGYSHQSSPSNNIFPKESLIQISVGTSPSTQTSEASVYLPPKSRSPILVTVIHSDTRQQSHHRRHSSPRSLVGSCSLWKEKCSQSRNRKNSEGSQILPFHLNKLKYNSTSKESRNDISLILNEYAEFNKIMMNDNQTVSQDKELNVASVEAVYQETYQPRQSVSYKDVITDLCTTLQVKLKGVVREACKSPFWFYLVETEDKSFFLRTKSILKKGGHKEIELLDFCQALHRENETLLVVIKNEDMISHLHQIPSLLKLKHFPGVVFAGVDSPEDIPNDTYQELFRSGGFVVSDDVILESLTLVQLKGILKILEKLNENGRWKWLLHYRENKKLKEDVKVDSIAQKKNLILKSYQSVNIIDLLHYHNCDSPSSTKGEILKCLLNLQIQHFSARFAVFLTDKPTAATEIFENNGILVTDINYFTENIQKIAAPFRSSYW